MKEIKLTKGYVSLVDDEDFDRLNMYKWTTRFKGSGLFYAYRISPRDDNGVAHSILMHREVIGYPSEGFQVDHIDHNGLNNQRSNLRFVSPRQNQQNRSIERKTSKYPGVSWKTKCNKWVAQIQEEKKVKHLGLFVNEEDAFAAYLSAVNMRGDVYIGGEIHAACTG
jgi:hypothetical protein